MVGALIAIVIVAGLFIWTMVDDYYNGKWCWEVLDVFRLC